MLIGKLAKSAGVSAATVRYYERLGLLRPARRSGSGYRQYDQNSIIGLLSIKAAQRLGFSLAEIRKILALSGGSRPGSEQLRAAAESKLDGIRREIAELKRRQDQLRRILQDCQCGPSKPCNFEQTTS
jgi:MerR family copper efflux transcriptional regulator